MSQMLNSGRFSKQKWPKKISERQSKKTHILNHKGRTSKKIGRLTAIDQRNQVNKRIVFDNMSDSGGESENTEFDVNIEARK